MSPLWLVWLLWVSSWQRRVIDFLPSVTIPASPEWTTAAGRDRSLGPRLSRMHVQRHVHPAETGCSGCTCRCTRSREGAPEAAGPVCNGRAACAPSWAMPLDQLKHGYLPTRSHCRRAPLSYSRSRTSKTTIYQVMIYQVTIYQVVAEQVCGGCRSVPVRVMTGCARCVALPGTEPWAPGHP